MSVLPSVDKVLRLAFIVSNSDGKIAVTRIFVKYSGSAPTNGELNTFCTAVATAWNTRIAPVTHNAWTLVEVTATDLSSPSSSIGLWSGTHVGTLAGGNIPGMVAFITSYQIARRYRGGHPRGYWPLGDETKVNDDRTWTSAFVTSVGTAIAGLFTDVVTAGWATAGTLTHVNVSYYNGFDVVTNPITHRARNVPKLRATPVTDNVIAYTLRKVFGTQRRRVQ